MQLIMASFLAVILAGIAFADQDRLIDASDTGIVFGDLDCQILSHEASPPSFSVDSFDYLYATVKITTRCVTREGMVYTTDGEDSVPFLLLRFDWLDQAWYKHNVLIATRRNSFQVEMNPAHKIEVWTDGQETHTTFRVEIWQKTADD